MWMTRDTEGVDENCKGAERIEKRTLGNLGGREDSLGPLRRSDEGEMPQVYLGAYFLIKNTSYRLSRMQCQSAKGFVHGTLDAFGMGRLLYR